jgi:hypothetical protein
MKASFIPALAMRPAEKAGIIFQDGKLGGFFIQVTSDIRTISDAFDRKYGKSCQIVERRELSVRRWCFAGGDLVLTNRGLPDQGKLTMIYHQKDVIAPNSPAEEILGLIGEPIGD